MILKLTQQNDFFLFTGLLDVLTDSSSDQIFRAGPIGRTSLAPN